MMRRLSIVLILVLAAATAGAAPWERSIDPLTVTGTVVDGDGQPLADTTVILEMRRESFSIRSLDQRTGPPLQLTTTSDASGDFRFEIQPDDHYNLFELGVGVEVQRNGRPAYEILSRREITDLVAGGGPVSVGIDVPEARFLRWLERWRDGRASVDEDKLFRDLGRPDRLTLDDGETSWWYFAEGKVYRLRDGDLAQVQHFEPIPDPAPAS